MINGSRMVLLLHSGSRDFFSLRFDVRNLTKFKLQYVYLLITIYQGFMTAVLQTHARRLKLAIDTLKFQTVVLEKNFDDIKEAPKTGIYLYV